VRSVLLVAVAVAACSSKPPDGPRDSGSAAAVAAAPPPTPGAPMPKVYLQTDQGEVAVSVEVVSTSAQVERGLMYREHLAPDAGMLFLMGQEQIWPFWMHNTLIPLDMIFIGRSLTVAGIVERAEPQTDKLRQIDRPSLYVLEVNGGWSAAHHVIDGAKVRFDGVRGVTP
jgi:hypothetical protein